MNAINMVNEMKNVDTDHLKKLPNLTITLKFNREKLVQQYEFFKKNPDYLKKDLIFLGKSRRKPRKKRDQKNIS